MAEVLKIYLIPDPILYTKSKEVPLHNPEIKQVLLSMHKTTVRFDGVGVAANQVGLPIRAVVVDSDRVTQDKIQQHGGKPLLMINPVILERSTELYHPTEGCMSLPNISSQVVRHDWVTVEYYDEDWNKQRIEKADKLLGQCIQHELDHIDGKLITDYLSPLKRNMINKKVEKFAKHHTVYNDQEAKDARVIYRNFI